jgi:hypothetical protein
MAGAEDNNLIRVDAIDQPIFRIYKKKWFLPILAKRPDALRNPSTWDDPFENFFLKRTRVDPGDGRLADLESLARDWYGQCWNSRSDNDAMWRIYSVDDTGGDAGIQVKTTIRKLFENLKKAGSPTPALQFFVGRVAYMSQDEIVAKMSALTFMDIAIGGQGGGFADLLCVKREAFSHESEVRILFQDLEPRRGLDQTFLYPLDPNALFEEIVLDPRLEDGEVKSLETELRAAGCGISIRQSDLYKVPEFIIPAMPT